MTSSYRTDNSRMSLDWLTPLMSDEFVVVVAAAAAVGGGGTYY